MKKTTLILALALCSIVALGQSQWQTESRPKLTKADSDTMRMAIEGYPVSKKMLDSNSVIIHSFEVLAADTSGDIFSFQMTSDTKRLKPIDTDYYTMSNEMYRVIRYKFFSGEKDMILTVRSYYDNRQWLFFGMELNPYIKEKK